MPNAKTKPRNPAPPSAPEGALGLLGYSEEFWTMIVALLAMAVYLPAIGFDLVYDSFTQVGIDQFIHEPGHWLDVLTLRVLGMDVLDFNRPVNLLTLMIDSRLWGLNPAGYHATNLLLHGATAALLFRWLLALVKRFWPAFLAAALFAVHPIHCEAVVEVGYREDLLATLFLLAGLNAAVRFRPEERGGCWWPAVLTICAFFISIASKESGVAGPAVLAAYWFLFRRKENWRPWVALIAATGVVVGGFLAIRLGLQPKNSGIFIESPSWLAATWDDLFLIQIRIWAAEFLRIVWPADLCADYNGYSIRNLQFLGALLSVGLFCGLQIVAGMRNRLVILGIAVFWFSLLPVSNFIPIYRPMADRFLYMPLIGVALMLAALMSNVRARAAWTPALVAAGMLVAGGLAAATYQQQQCWRTDLSLWSETAQRNPFSYNVWLGLGFAWLDRNEPGCALDAFSRASTLAQNNKSSALGGLALASEALGKRTDAAQFLARAIKLDPHYSDADQLVRALLVTPSQARRLAVIAARSRLSTHSL